MKQAKPLVTGELEDLARQALDVLHTVFEGEVNDEALQRANLAVGLLNEVTQRYKAQAKRLALEARMAKAMRQNALREKG
jgi:hypothetical protein